MGKESRITLLFTANRIADSLPAAPVFIKTNQGIWTAIATVVFFNDIVSVHLRSPGRAGMELQKRSILKRKYFVLPNVCNVLCCRLPIRSISQVPFWASFWLYELITSGEVILTHMPLGAIIYLNDWTNQEGNISTVEWNPLFLYEYYKSFVNNMLILDM